MMQYYASVLRTRSYAKDPVGTCLRGLGYVMHSTLRREPIFGIPFGPVRFHMRLQQARKHFGAAGIFVRRQYYESLLEFGYKFLSEGDTVIDGGANQGIFTCAFGVFVGSTGRVFAFEPQSYATSCIRMNCELNGLENVEIFEGALSRTSGEGFLDTSRGPVAASIVRDFGSRCGVPVKTYAIDELRAQNRMPAVNFCKLDIEGAELDALIGARETIEQDAPGICLEAHDAGLFTNVDDFLRQHGYKPYIFDDDGALAKFERFVPAANVFFLQ
jgi:FkbM family methyltransferase